MPLSEGPLGDHADPIRLGAGAEFDLIRRFLRSAGSTAGTAGRADVRVGPGDDCAVVAGDGIAVSSDLSVEGVHFRRDWIEVDEIGYRAAAAALSDLAAVAARPIGVLASLALPEADAGEPAVRLMDGVRSAAEAAGAALLGGDVARTPGPLAIDVVVLGETARPVLRAGARPGDSLWVTGWLGAAAAAVACWGRGIEPPPEARAAFAHPRPRHAEANWLAAEGALHALIDLSDGLAGDAAHLAAASGVAVVLDTARVPIHPAALAATSGEEEALRLALAGGEDYELCFAAPPDAVEPLLDRFEKAFGVPLSRVGIVREGKGVHRQLANGEIEPLDVAGYRHFEGEVR